MPPTAAERDELRGGIAREYSNRREVIEKKYVEDRNALSDGYQRDIRTIEEQRRQAFLDAGLNSDGSDPQGRPAG